MIELIPAIDVIRLGSVYDFLRATYQSKKVYNENPVKWPRCLKRMASIACMVVDPGRSGLPSNVVNYKILEALAGQTSLVIDFGGGIKSDEDLHIAFESGAQMVTLGSIAVKEPDTFNRWMKVYGSERIILGADAKDGKIAVNGWLECSRLELMPFLDDYIKKGVAKVLCTDISRDGMLNGPSLELYKQIMEAHPDLHLIASGGISGMKDIEALNEAGIPAVVFGKAFYEGRITLQDLKAFLP